MNNTINQSSGTAQLKATFPNANRALWPGEFVNVRLIVRVQHDGITVPLSALQQGQSSSLVYIVQPDGTVQQRPVAVTQTLDGRALIGQGLKAGDTVVTAGQYRLSDGIKVIEVAAGESAGAGQLAKQARGCCDEHSQQPFIRRPVATALLMVAIVLLGATRMSCYRSPRCRMLHFPTISVTAQLPGADPQTMASSVATPLEKQFGQIPYLTQMTSTSSLGYTQIILQFALNDDINAAAQLVQTAINAAAGQLPKNMPSPPTYHETNPSDAPILVLGLTSDDAADHDGGRLRREHPRAETVAGTGGRARRHRRRAASRDSYSVQSGAARGEWPVPGGRADGADQCERGSAEGQPVRARPAPTTLQTNDQILTPQDWNNQIIAYRNGGPIRVSDVWQGDHRATGRDVEGVGQPQQRGIVLAIQRLPGANVISTVEAIKAALPQLEASIPPIDQGFGDIGPHDHHPRLGGRRAVHAAPDDRLVVGVIFVFLRSLWATVIPAIAVPVSIIGTFGVMYALGYSLDNLSLMGLSIAVGFVVDDAIVMVENIARHIEMGKKPLQAALDARGEIGFTILSISISLVAVFIPLAADERHGRPHVPGVRCHCHGRDLRSPRWCH